MIITDTLISIGKMAKLNNTTVATLRLYDEKKLLCPFYTDENTGYRFYSPSQCYRFDMISYMKELGMSLFEIESVFRKENIGMIEEILSEKNEQIYKQMRELKSRREAVKRTIESIERCRKSPKKGVTTLEYIDRRSIWAVECSSDFYKNGIDDYKAQEYDLRERLLKKGVRQVHSYAICTSVKKENFIRDIYVPYELFAVTDRHFELYGETKLLDSGMYACIYLDNFDDEIIYGKRLKEYCRDNNYEINGDYICEVMSRFDIFDAGSTAMFLRLQVPVKF